MDYTVEIYKVDRRCKTGMVLVYKTDYNDVDLAQIQRMYPERPGYIVKILETYVTLKNFMTGRDYQERYDTPYTPYTASASSETYWSS